MSETNDRVHAEVSAALRRMVRVATIVGENFEYTAGRVRPPLGTAAENECLIVHLKNTAHVAREVIPLPPPDAPRTGLDPTDHEEILTATMAEGRFLWAWRAAGMPVFVPSPALFRRLRHVIAPDLARTPFARYRHAPRATVLSYERYPGGLPNIDGIEVTHVGFGTGLQYTSTDAATLQLLHKLRYEKTDRSDVNRLLSALRRTQGEGTTSEAPVVWTVLWSESRGSTASAVVVHASDPPRERTLGDVMLAGSPVEQHLKACVPGEYNPACDVCAMSLAPVALQHYLRTETALAEWNPERHYALTRKNARRPVPIVWEVGHAADVQEEV